MACLLHFVGKTLQHLRAGTVKKTNWCSLVFTGHFHRKWALLLAALDKDIGRKLGRIFRVDQELVFDVY